jgi:hypothetical protein
MTSNVCKGRPPRSPLGASPSQSLSLNTTIIVFTPLFPTSRFSHFDALDNSIQEIRGEKLISHQVYQEFPYILMYRYMQGICSHVVPDFEIRWFEVSTSTFYTTKVGITRP